MEYILIQDNDCHWYIIPANKQSHFNKSIEEDPVSVYSSIVPDYAEEVGGSYTLVKFKEYRIE